MERNPQQNNSSQLPPRVISVVSGKGGCGKTLLSAVLGLALAREGMTVVLVDMDIFVRGLTILLAPFRSADRRADGRTVSDFLGAARNDTQGPLSGVQTFRFLECDVMPASRGIADPLDYDEATLSSFEFASRSIGEILAGLTPKYDLVILDCRAGIDSLVLAACRQSQLVLSIAEDDDVCLQANTNLVNDLRYRNKVSDVFTIINKGRRIQSIDELRDGVRRPDFNYAGVVPFDVEIMQDFGKSRLWNNVFGSLYFHGLITSWNYIAQSTGVPHLSASKYYFAPRIFGSARSGQHALVERMFRLYGFCASCGALLWLIWQLMSLSQSEILFRLSMPFLMLIMGVVMLAMSTTPLRRWLLGRTDAPRLIETSSQDQESHKRYTAERE